MVKPTAGKYPAYERYLNIPKEEYLNITKDDEVLHAESPSRSKVIPAKTLVWVVALGIIAFFVFLTLKG